MPMTSQEAEHRTLEKKMPRQKLDIQKLTLTIITSLHKSMIPAPIKPAPQTIPARSTGHAFSPVVCRWLRQGLFGTVYLGCFRRFHVVGFGGRPAFAESDGKGVESGLPAHRLSGLSATDRVRGADHGADVDVLVPERNALFPGVLPEPDDRPVSLAQLVCQFVQSRPSGAGVGGRRSLGRTCRSRHGSSGRSGHSCRTSHPPHQCRPTARGRLSPRPGCPRSQHRWAG